MKNLMLFGLILCMMLTAGSVAAQDSGKEKAAMAAAETWLSVVDSGKYGQSWEEAAEYLRNALSQEEWVQALKTVRSPLGKCLSRKVIRTDYRTALPGAPDGEYVVIQFESSFENKKSAIETVTPMVEKGGAWRVSGYYIQ